jgi:hypothetical protein
MQEAVIAKAIFDALRRVNPRALVDGDPTADFANSNVLIDGNFNFRILARFVRKALEAAETPG